MFYSVAAIVITILNIHWWLWWCLCCLWKLSNLF